MYSEYYNNEDAGDLAAANAAGFSEERFDEISAALGDIEDPEILRGLCHHWGIRYEITDSRADLNDRILGDYLNGNHDIKPSKIPS